MEDTKKQNKISELEFVTYDVYKLKTLTQVLNIKLGFIDTVYQLDMKRKYFSYNLFCNSSYFQS